MLMPFGETQRHVAAVAIERKIAELVDKFHIGIPHYTWNLDQGMNHSGPHRLDVRIMADDLSAASARNTELRIKIYFADCELAAIAAGNDWNGLQARLQQCLSKLEDQEFALQYRAMPVQARAYCIH